MAPFRVRVGRLALGLCSAIVFICAPARAGVILNPGDVVVAEAATGTLYRVDPVTGASAVISSGGSLHSTHGIAFDPQGRIVAANDWSGQTQRGNVVRVTPATGAQSVLYSGADADDPWAPVVLPNGDVLFSDYGNATSEGGKIRRVDAATNAKYTFAAGGLMRQTLNMVHDGANNRLYITDRSGYVSPRLPRILSLDLGTKAVAVVSDGNLLSDPHGIAREPSSGDLFVADLDAKIIRVNPLTGAQSIVSSGGLLVDPSDLAFDQAGRLLVTDVRGSGGSVVVRVDVSSGAQSLLTPTTLGADLWGIAVYVPEPTCLTVVCLASLPLLWRRGILARH